MDEKTLVCVARIDVTDLLKDVSRCTRRSARNMYIDVIAQDIQAAYLWEFQFNQPEKIWNPAPTKRFCNPLRCQDFPWLTWRSLTARGRPAEWNSSPDEKWRSEESLKKEFEHRFRQDSFWMDKKTFTIFLLFFIVGVRSLFWCIFMKHDKSKMVY